MASSTCGLSCCSSECGQVKVLPRAGDQRLRLHVVCSIVVPSVAKLKSYPVRETNGFVYMWFHAEGVEPYWSPPEIEEIRTGQWTWRGRTEHVVNAHIQVGLCNGNNLYNRVLSKHTEIRYSRIIFRQSRRHKLVHTSVVTQHITP